MEHYVSKLAEAQAKKLNKELQKISQLGEEIQAGAFVG
jgi:hypothetical protein